MATLLFLLSDDDRLRRHLVALKELSASHYSTVLVCTTPAHGPSFYACIPDHVREREREMVKLSPYLKKMCLI